jgi:hypothetical protein
MITIAQARVAKDTEAPVIVITEGPYKGDAEVVQAIAHDIDGGWHLETLSKNIGVSFRRPEHVEPSPELLKAVEEGEYDSLGYREGEMSPEQKKIYEQAEDLIELLRQVVPNTTIHWAVEEARRALRDLSKHAGSILTDDRRPPVEGDDEGYMPAERQLLP